MGLFLVLIAVALGGNVILVKFAGIEAQYVWLVSLAVILIASAVLGRSVCKRWDGILIDNDNRISLSRFQLICWTILLIGSLACVGIHNFVVAGDGSGALNITIPPEIWSLLGLPAFTAVTAAAIKDAKRSETSTAKPDDVTALNAAVKQQQNLAQLPEQDGRVLTKATPSEARWIDMVMGDFEGAQTVDASKFQKLMITLLVLGVYGGDLWHSLAITPGMIDSFPTISPGFLALLGISHAAYLADKQFSQS